MPRLGQFASIFLATVAAAPLPGERDLTNYTYNQYVVEFNRGAPSEQENSARKQIFEENLAIIREHNADPAKTWFATVNEFTDWTNEEFRLRRTSRQPRDEDSAVDTHEAIPPVVDFEKELQLVPSEELADSIDWREKEGIVTAVKNQGGCGSCWAFSAVETLESHLAIATQKAAPVLSEQQVVSCVQNPKDCGGTGGCAGATQPLAFNYTHGAGITLESDYRYRGLTGTCEKSQIKPVATNDGYVKLKVNDYTSLMTAVATKGPVAISLAAGSLGWQLYGGGVFGSGVLAKCGWDQDHGVQLVGYGAEGSSLYWLVRNSWGAGWGESGYIRIKRFGEGEEPCGVDKTPQDGEACAGDVKPRTYCGFCGILGSSSYPTGLRSLDSNTRVLV